MIKPLNQHADRIAIIAKINEIIKALNASKQDDDTVRRHLLGIAKVYEREER